MNIEDKDLLLIDLCSRVPYGVKVKSINNNIKTIRTVDIVEGVVRFIEPDTISPFGVHIEHPTRLHQVIKPYLRPISSMTDEEKEEFNKIKESVEASFINAINKNGFTLAYYELIDWLNANQFDYRGLIPRDLAIKVTEENNPYK